MTGLTFPRRTLKLRVNAEARGCREMCPRSRRLGQVAQDWPPVAAHTPHHRLRLQAPPSPPGQGLTLTSLPEVSEFA